jgi:hypothetical protein
LLGALPLVALVIGVATFSEQDRVALDFHHELYPQAELLVEGRVPYPAPDADLADGTNLIWPIAAVLPVVPLTALSAQAADWVATGIVLASLVAALWVLRVRDWRVYGLVTLWPPVIDAYQTANLTLPLALLVAVTWTYRARPLGAGGALGVALALKFFVWPVTVWLVATRRHTAAAIAAVLGAASLFLLLPFIGVADYVRLIRNLSDTFDELSYTPYALLVDLGAPTGIARAATLASGAGVLLLAWRRRSLTLAIGASLLLSPIVWRHFFALLLVPAAIALPRLGALWFLPLGFWFVPGTYNGETWQTALALALAGAMLAVCERRTREEGATASLSEARPKRPSGRPQTTT